MKRLLFVDDEPNVLQALHRMLRSFRREWTMEFAEGGAKALDLLARQPFDVVLTDMRMPGMDGAELLENVVRLYPGAVRIVLSGQCDRQSVLSCVGPAHQFLTKPCASETLRSTILRACSACDRIIDQRHKRMLSRVTSIPSLPAVHAELIAELSSPQASVRSVAEIASRDAGIAAKILQLISSSFFGSPQQNPDITEAVKLLGLDTIKPLALSRKVFVPFDRNAVDGGWLQERMDHGLAVGTAAKAIAEVETADRALAGDAFLAGFLHEVGTLALVQPPADSHGPPCHGEAASALAEETQAEAGAYLMALWGLPDRIVTAIALRHSPQRSADREFTPLAAAHAAHAILNETAGEMESSSALSVDYLARIGCAERLDAWRERCWAAVPEGACR
jgi:HD-like signal output (HDOD) protein/CheY-like chemotaxis protein